MCPFRFRVSSFSDSRPHRLRKTSSKQSKRRDLHLKWLHRETNDNTLYYYCIYHDERQQPFPRHIYYFNYCGFIIVFNISFLLATPWLFPCCYCDSVFTYIGGTIKGRSQLKRGWCWNFAFSPNCFVFAIFFKDQSWFLKFCVSRQCSKK